MIHWSENNTSIHHVGAALHALAFTPGQDPNRLALGYLFDEHAKLQSKAALRAQLPKLIFDAADQDTAPTLEQIIGPTL